ILDISAPLASLGACRAGAASFTEAVFTLNRLFCRYWPPKPAAAATPATAPPAARNLRRSTTNHPLPIECGTRPLAPPVPSVSQMPSVPQMPHSDQPDQGGDARDPADDRRDHVADVAFRPGDSDERPEKAEQPDPGDPDGHPPPGEHPDQYREEGDRDVHAEQQHVLV